MDIKDLIARIRKLDRYDSAMEYGCSCCDDSGYATMRKDALGSYVQVDELDLLLKEFEDGN